MWKRSGLDSLRRMPERRFFPLAMGLFAIALMLPSVGNGLFQDDVMHWAKLRKDAGLPQKYYGTPLLPRDSGTAVGAMRDMFAVARTPEDIRTLRNQGLVPWWTSERLRLSNWRPLAAFTHWLDYRFFPDSPVLMHLHNLLWFGLVVALVAVLYRRLMGVASVAGLAALLYVLDESNYFPVAWLANRNLLMALFFSLVVLLCHDRWRRYSHFGCGVAAPLLLALSLLSTEAAVATFAYLFAYALVMDRGPRVHRALSLVPAVLVIVAWRIVYDSMGHGASGGGFVIDPGREPWPYALAALKRVPFLLVGQWTPLPADTAWMFSARAQEWLLVRVCVFLFLMAVVLLPLIRKDRSSLFWLVGMLAALPPICATAPMNRNLLFVAVGGFALAARFIAGVLGGATWLPRSQFYRVPIWIVCVVLLLAHIPVALAGRIWSQKMFFSLSRNAIYSTIEIGEPTGLSSKNLMVVNAPNPFLFVALPVLRCYEGKPLPGLAQVLVPGWRSLEVTRTGASTLVVRSREGNLLSVDESRRNAQPSFLYMYRTFNTIWRSAAEPFEVGGRTTLPDLSVEVLSVDGGGFPESVRFDFALPLEDSTFHWLQWDWRSRGLGSYSDFSLPAPGETIVLPGPR